jgi:hypothetical protein
VRVAGLASRLINQDVLLSNGEDAELMIFRRGRLVRRAENVGRCMECPCHVTLSRSEGSVSTGREMLPLRFAMGFGSHAQHDMADYLQHYLSLVTRNARPPRAERELLHKLR